MSATLSQTDVDRLLTDSSAQTRAEVAAKLGQSLENPQLTEGEIKSAQDIVRIMAKDIEVNVRAALARSLRHAPHLPHDVAVQMAKDLDVVALPILAHSLVLTDDDLIEVVRAGPGLKQMAIAGRTDVSEPVAAAVVNSGDETTVGVLMWNQGARISEQSLSRAIERFPDSDEVKESMARREALPITVAERLVVMVSDRLREHLVTHHKLPAELATDILLETREHATLDLSNGIGAAHVEELVRQMHRSGRLTPTMVLRALCIGDMAFFESSLAVMANVPVENARILIHDRGGKGFSALYDRSGLQKDLYPAFRAATDVIDSTQFDGQPHDMERFRARVITRMLTQFDEFDQENLDYLVKKLGEVLTLGHPTQSRLH
jgi:uncharacterized protein (DUF2336 family)